jgi:hypothetical protein
MSLWAVGGFEMKKCYSIAGGIASDSEVYSNGLTALDGDFDKIRIADETQDEGVRIVPKSYYDGRPVVPSTMPEYLVQYGPQEYALRDLEQVGYALVGTKAFKDTVEELEPGVHQFFAVKVIRQGDKSKTPIAERYLMVICNRLDSLDKAKCTPPLGEKDFARLQTKLVFSGKKIGKAYVWVEKFRSRGIFISEQLHARLEKLNLTGYSYHPYDVAE